MRSALRLAAGSLLLLLSCSTEFHPRPCSVDSDCGERLACVGDQGDRRCDAPSKEPLRIGMSAPGSGPNIELGVEMKRGVQLAFDAQNAAGGVRGRPLVLEFRDDQYEATLAEQTAKDLLDIQPADGSPRCPTTMTPPAGGAPLSTQALKRGPGAVLAVLGNVGTPTMVRFAPLAVETGTIFFGAFTGAKAMLRDDEAGDCRRYIFNVRASYAQEARATLEYFQSVGIADYRHLMSFDQEDSFGDAGYSGLVAAYTDRIGPLDGTPGIARFRYQRNVVASVPKAIAGATAYLDGLLASDQGNLTVGVLMTDTYAPGDTFIRGVRDWQNGAPDRAARLKLYFSNVSFVGPNALAERLAQGTVANTDGGSYTENVIVSQVVPNYDGDPSDVVRQYEAALKPTGVDPTFTSLEGYIAARVFVGGLLAHQGPFTPEALVATLERLPNLNIGLGATSGFAPDNHNYSKTVWGTSITREGRFKNLYYWSDGSPLQFFE